MWFFRDKDVEQRENDMYEAHCIQCGSDDVSVARTSSGTTACCNDCEHVHEIDTVYEKSKDKFFTEGGIMSSFRVREISTEIVTLLEELTEINDKSTRLNDYNEPVPDNMYATIQTLQVVVGIGGSFDTENNLIYGGLELPFDQLHMLGKTYEVLKLHPNGDITTEDKLLWPKAWVAKIINGPSF